MSSGYKIIVVKYYCTKLTDVQIRKMKLKSKLPELMQVKGVDQKTVAAATGLSATTVGKLYRNHFDRIDNHTITSLCEYFGLKDLGQLIELVSEGGSQVSN